PPKRDWRSRGREVPAIDVKRRRQCVDAGKGWKVQAANPRQIDIRLHATAEIGQAGRIKAISEPMYQRRTLQIVNSRDHEPSVTWASRPRAKRPWARRAHATKYHFNVTSTRCGKYSSNSMYVR